jgi:hypothetical protein
MKEDTFRLELLLENTDFYNVDANRPYFLGFKLNFQIEPKEDYIIEGDVLLHFEPKKKEFVLSEFSLGKGYEYFTLTNELLCDVHNKSKVNIKEPDSDRNYIFLAKWNQSGVEFDKLKIETYKKWWSDNFDKIINHIISNKNEYNERIKKQILNILID